MKKIINLVTTPIKKLYSNSHSNLFLGRWCIEDRDSLNNKNIQSYRQEDLINYKNFHYINNINNRIFRTLFKKLNKYHNLRLSEKYWKIILFPWISNFTTTVFDRWKIIEKVKKENKFQNTNLFNLKDEDFIPFDFAEFYHDFSEQNLWNHFIFSKILTILTPKKIKLKKYCGKKIKKDNIEIKNHLIKINKHQKYFIVNTYFGKVKSTLINLSLKSLPIINKHKFYINKKINLQKRKKIKINLNKKNKFENFLSKLIPLQIPHIYLESFIQARKEISKVSWPSKPKIIFSSNILWGNSTELFYVAEKFENFKTKIFTMQHGGTYGQLKFNLAEQHEIDISDKYLSWGWKKKNSGNKIIPFSINRKFLDKNSNNNKKNNISLITKGLRTYSLNNQSDLNYFDQIKYLKELNFFLNIVNSKFPNKCIVRDKSKFRSWRIDKIVKNYPNILYGSDNLKFNWYLKNTRIFVCLNNSTTYLQLLNSNYPTLIYFDVNKNIYRPETINHIKILKRASIFHDSIDSLIQQLNKIYDDVDTWWNSKKVQHGKDKFIKNYANNNQNIFKLRKLIKN